MTSPHRADHLENNALDVPAVRLSEAPARPRSPGRALGRTARSDRKQELSVIESALGFAKSPVKPGSETRDRFGLPSRARRCHLLGDEAFNPALVAALAASPAFAADDGYPKGLFEHSPVVPGPNDPPDADPPPLDPGAPPEPGGQADGNSALDDYCASIAGQRTFRSSAEVKRAHAKCDQGDPARDQ